MNSVATDKLKADLLNVDWNKVYQDDDVNVASNTFLSTDKNIYERNCPIKRVCVNQKSRDKPWITNELKNACRKKINLYIRFF